MRQPLTAPVRETPISTRLPRLVDSRDALVILAAVLVDRQLGEPPAALHPVVWMGRTVGALERLRPHDNARPEWLWGASAVGVTVTASAAAAYAAVRAARRLPPALSIVVEAWLLKTLFSWKALETAAGRCAADLLEGRLDHARDDLSWLVSRDRTDLSAEEVAAAAIESVAENASDSVAAPLLAYSLGGLPAAAAYRAINTLDAMVGYRGDYEFAGKVPARLDDLANLAPARLTALLICLAAPRANTLRSAWWCHGETESPNAGWPMAAAAGALGVRLTKRGQYCLNAGGQPPGPRQITEAILLLRRVGAGVLLVTAVLSSLRAASVRRQKEASA